MTLDVVSEATPHLFGTAAVQALKLTCEQIVNRGAIDQIPDFTGALSHMSSDNSTAIYAATSLNRRRVSI